MFSDTSEELAQSKLLLLYIIEMSPSTFTKEELNDYILERGFLNYFLIQQYLKELMDSGFIQLIEEDGKEKYRTLENGIQALSYFDSKIQSKLKEQIKKDFSNQKLNKKLDAQVVADYFVKEDNQYMVNLKLVENDDILFSLYLSVPSLDQAQIITKAWKERTGEIYSNIMNMFIL